MEKYLVKRICKQASDNEDNSENTIETLDLYLETIDVYRTQKKISVSESEFKEKGISEGDIILFNSNDELVKIGVFVNLMQLILENSKTDIDKIESIYCADTDWLEVTIIINDEEKLVLEIKDSIEGINSWRVWHRGYIGAC